jgi:RNA polymerase sigma factor (sigma-70 family)
VLSTDHCTAASAGLPFPHRIASGMTSHMDRMASATDAGADRADLARLLHRVARGDRSSLKALYERTSAKLFGICLRVTGDQADAQDVLQDVFVTVWQKAGQFDRAKASPITWLSVMTRNKAIDLLRTRRAPSGEMSEAADIADSSPSALDIVEQADDASRLDRCLGSLDDRARRMIRASFFEGATYGALAEREGVPLPTMKSWIRRGLLRLRDCLER